jgi:polyhydroxybutyrate depolymerase
VGHRLRVLLGLAAAAALALLVAGTAGGLAPGARAQACAPAAGDHRLGTALLHVPAHARGPLPLVLAFHGAHGNGPGFARESGLSRTADRHGFAVLYPTAAARDRMWSLGAHARPDDIPLVEALLARAAPLACTDARRIYATGVSNGGGFAARVGCELAGTVAAIAPVAGGYRSLDPCPRGRRTSVLEIHGSADQVVPYGGRPPDRAGAVQAYVGGWVGRDGCDPEPRQRRMQKHVTRFIHTGCAPGLAVEHLRLGGTTHGWPGARPPWPSRNPSGLAANEPVWAFFAAHPLVPAEGAGAPA